MDYTVHGILQARILEWIAFPYPGDLPNPGIEPRSPAMQADSLPAGPPGNPYSYYEKWKLLRCVQLFVTPWTIQSTEFSRPEYWSGYQSLLQSIFSTQGSNPGLLLAGGFSQILFSYLIVKLGSKVFTGMLIAKQLVYFKNYFDHQTDVPIKVSSFKIIKWAFLLGSLS